MSGMHSDAYVANLITSAERTVRYLLALAGDMEQSAHSCRAHGDETGAKYREHVAGQARRTAESLTADIEGE